MLNIHGVLLICRAASSLNLTYYLLEIKGLPGSNGTIFPAAGTGELNYSAAGWGTFFVFENPIREGPSENTTLLGHATGTAVVTTTQGITGGIQVSAQHVFTYPPLYNQSSITVVGRVDFLGTPPWECVVSGGTGYFRGYMGYGIADLLTSAFAPTVVYKWNFFLTKFI